MTLLNFINRVKNKAEEKQNQIAEKILSGRVKDMEEYKMLTGQLYGISVTIAYLLEVLGELERGGIDE